MNYEHFTNASQDLINKSATLANQLRNPVLLTIHTLAAGLENEFCLSFFNVLEIPLIELKKIVENDLRSLITASPGHQLAVDQSLQGFLKNCQKEATDMGDHFISLEHFLIGWASTLHYKKKEDLPDLVLIDGGKG